MNRKYFWQHAKRMACPCGQGVFDQCCGRFLIQGKVPQTALELMRSRYTAYYLREEGYLKETWFATTRPRGVFFNERDSIKWVSLEVLQHKEDGPEATIEFVARYKEQGKAKKLHEISRFILDEGRWHYLDGAFPSDAA